MAGNAATTPIERLEAFARGRFGLFTPTEAARFGVSRALLGYHSRSSGRWSRVLPSVYQLAGQPPDRRRPLFAALLWGGDDAVLSHRSAAAVLRLDGVRFGRPELRTYRKALRGGPIVHRPPVGPDVATRTGLLRHTGVLRTVIDLATVLDDDTLELVIESAIRRQPTCEAILRLVASQGCYGAPRLRRVLARRVPGSPPTDSELETRYLQVIRAGDVPPPVRQHRVLDDTGRCIGRLDLCWPEVGLWVELDGRATHDRPQALLYDRHRQNEVATRLQWLPLRFTWDDVVMHSAHTASFTETAYRRRAGWQANTRAPAGDP